MTAERVFVTGLGAVSAAGEDCAATLANFREGTRNVGAPTVFSTDVAKPVFEVRDRMAVNGTHGMRTLALLLRAVDEALAEAGLGAIPPSTRVGVCLGTTVACQLNDIDFYEEFRAKGTAPMAAVDRYLRGNLSAAVARHYALSGPTLTIVNACSSGTDAIGMAMGWLRDGLCDVAIAGGADELNRVPMAGFNALGIMSEQPCAPFDADRQGLNLGEGAGVVILESPASSAARGVAAQLTCAGYGTFGDAYHLTAPREDGSGLEAAVIGALSDAGLSAREIAFVNAHGTATPTNDRVEGSVLARVFRGACPVCSTKGFTGHALGAAGGLEAVFTGLGLREGWIPGTAGFVTRDDAIPLVPTQAATEIEGQYAMSTSLAFGGNNSALILGRA
jgi:3-oxoacyl-[acyl-carrier-protein] synthase II